MIMTNKLLRVALVAALIGGSVGAIVMHSRSQPTTAEPVSTTATIPATDAQYQTAATSGASFVPAEFSSPAEQSAYKTGFADGFRACSSGASGTQLSSTTP